MLKLHSKPTASHHIDILTHSRHIDIYLVKLSHAAITRILQCSTEHATPSSTTRASGALFRQTEALPQTQPTGITSAFFDITPSTGAEPGVFLVGLTSHQQAHKSRRHEN